MTIPGNWYLNGLDHAGVVWFRKSIALPLLDGDRARLQFNGVDYACDVWVNGTWVGHHEGGFTPFAFDVTPHLKGGANLIAIRVNSPEEPFGSVWSLRKRLIKGVLNHHDTRPGGAWSTRGQEKNSGGIWAPVSLHFSKKIAITELSVSPRLKGKSAIAEATLSLSTPEFSGDTVHLEWALTPENFTAPTAPVRGQTTLSPDADTTEAQFTLTVKRPKLWWPWELGKPNLYRLTVIARQGQTILDRRSEVFGFRDITRDPTTKSWRINGKRIFLRGTNYISSQWPSEMTQERLAFDLTLMKNAHINAIRVHAHVEPRAFYGLCDAMGVLVWQDFPLQWGYADDKAFTAQAVKQVQGMVAQLYNHPSIFTWCGHNEPPWDAQWMKWKYPDYDPDQNRNLDKAILKALITMDTTRPSQGHSSTAEHPWLGWYSGSWRDYAKPTALPLVSEFGAQALPDRSTLARFLPAWALWPTTDKAWELWRYHNFQKRETFDIAGVKKGKNLEAFIDNSQTYQADLIQLAVESYRRQRFAPVTGIFQFMFVEGWPSINWGVVDYLRNPKPGYAALKLAYQPLLPSIEMQKEIWLPGETVTATLWVINDLPHGVPKATLSYALRSKESPFPETRIALAITPGSARRVATLSQPGLPEGEYAIDATIQNTQGKILSQNSLSFRIAAKKEETKQP